jgi:hypothetical protein
MALKWLGMICSSLDCEHKCVKVPGSISRSVICKSTFSSIEFPTLSKMRIKLSKFFQANTDGPQLLSSVHYHKCRIRIDENFAWARNVSPFSPVSIFISSLGHGSTPRKGFIQYRIVSLNPVQCFGSVFTESRSRSFA